MERSNELHPVINVMRFKTKTYGDIVVSFNTDNKTRTLCQISSTRLGLMTAVFTYCNKSLDQYKLYEGMKITLERGLRGSNLGRPFRKLIWERFHILFTGKDIYCGKKHQYCYKAGTQKNLSK